MAVSERGDVAGSLTGGCVEPALYKEARAILAVFHHGRRAPTAGEFFALRSR
jgi:xanthine/CO dehydrogenase XdhC/CoxF family maturation factor